MLFTKPAVPGAVKTRLIGELSAAQAAELHAAFLADLSERLCGGAFELRVAWALDEGEEFPSHLVVGPAENLRQVVGDLGARLYHGLQAAAERASVVAAIGSDHPELRPEIVEDAFRRLESGTDAVFGPVPDGGYYLVGLRCEAVRREIFENIPWSTESVLDMSLERCRQLGLSIELLPGGHDIDVPHDLRQLAGRLSQQGTGCPRTRRLLMQWGRLEAAR
ncbi:MAG: TIGR04282 family arsenosugar biosynthesis glycosyltransferase [Acidobacteriota bacterium]